MKSRIYNLHSRTATVKEQEQQALPRRRQGLSGHTLLTMTLVRRRGGFSVMGRQRQLEGKDATLAIHDRLQGRRNPLLDPRARLSEFY